MRRSLAANLKNIPGWKTAEQLVVFAVDDFGSVRLDSSKARDQLEDAGLVLKGRFDRMDALETRQDLEGLFDVLSSVEDARGCPVVLTAYSLCANPDFESVTEAEGDYVYEALPRTFERLASIQPEAYEGAWLLWQEGMSRGVIRPQFHGREHINVELFERKLRRSDPAIKANVANQSLAALDGEHSMPGVGFTHAFGVYDRSETERHREIIEDGLHLFESVFGFKSATFTPPAQKIHPDLYPYLDSFGLRGVFKPRWCKRRIDRDHFVNELNVRELNRKNGHLSLVRNVVFEPTNDKKVDSVRLALDQVGAAFRWRRPAVISSHRVNFSGHIDSDNRRRGLSALRELLLGIVQRWPDTQFIGADELVEKIEASRE